MAVQQEERDAILAKHFKTMSEVPEPVPQFTPYVPPKILTNAPFSRDGSEDPNTNQEIVSLANFPIFLKKSLVKFHRWLKLNIRIFLSLSGISKKGAKSLS